MPEVRPKEPAPTTRLHCRVTTAAGRRLAYVEAGDGPDVLLLHGTLTTLEDMQLALFATLQPRYRVVALDRPSHGDSDATAADSSLWHQATTIRDACEALGLCRPIVCGHSYGGAVALAMGMAYPDVVRGVVGLAPICFPELRLEHVLFGPRPLLDGRASAAFDPLLLPALWRAMFLPQVMPPDFEARFPFALAGRWRQTLTEGAAANSLWFDLARSVARYPSCGVPVRFLAGTRDLVVHPGHSLAASRLIPEADTELVPGMGHMLHHFRPDLVAAHVARLAEHADTA